MLQPLASELMILLHSNVPAAKIIQKKNHWVFSQILSKLAKLGLVCHFIFNL